MTNVVHEQRATKPNEVVRMPISFEQAINREAIPTATSKNNSEKCGRLMDWLLTIPHPEDLWVGRKRVYGK